MRSISFIALNIATLAFPTTLVGQGDGQANARDADQAEALGKQITVSTEGGRIHADGPSSQGRSGWSVSYEIYVPRHSNLEAITQNGGVTATLSGSSWRGRGLDLRTTNGGVSLSIPRAYNARLETGTTNGGMNIDFPSGPVVRVVTTNGGVRVRQQ